MEWESIPSFRSQKLFRAEFRSRKSPIFRGPSSKAKNFPVFMIRLYFHLLKPSLQTKKHMPKASIYSIAIQILLPHILLQRTTATEDMLSRTLRRFLLRSRKWTMSTIFRIVRHGIRSMIPWAAFLLWKKSNSVSQATVVVLAAVVSVR